MKTFRQNLNIWLEEQKNESGSPEVKIVLEQVQTYIKSQEKEEENMVNSAYDRGYFDKELKHTKKGNYYQQTYKLHDKLKKMIK
jgi:hypothetical protein